MREFLPMFRGKYRALRVGVVLALAVWLAFQPLIRGLTHAPTGAGWVIASVGVIAICLIALGIWYLLMAPLRATLAELTVTGTLVFCISIDPVWMPLGSSFTGSGGPGFLIVTSEGIRIVDESRREILLAAWDEVVQIQPNRAPAAIAELELNRDGAMTHWWFRVLGGVALFPVGARRIDGFVRQLQAVKAGAPKREVSI